MGGEADVGKRDYHGFYLVLLSDLLHHVFDKPAYLPDHLLSGFALGRRNVGGELDRELLKDFIEVVIESVYFENVGQVGGVA